GIARPEEASFFIHNMRFFMCFERSGHIVPRVQLFSLLIEGLFSLLIALLRTGTIVIQCFYLYSPLCQLCVPPAIMTFTLLYLSRKLFLQLRHHVIELYILIV